MSKLSPAYREDHAEGIDPRLRKHLDESYFQKLPHVTGLNPRLLVVFAGGNGVGKSTLAIKIGDELAGLVLENDAIKRQLLALLPTIAGEKLNTITWQYTMDLYKRLPEITNNGLIVRDGVIHWYFDRILPIFEKQGYELFVVRYEISDELSRQLIADRGDKETVSASRLQELLIDQKIHLKRFKEAVRTDIVLTDETLFDHDRVVTALRQKVATSCV